MAQRRAYTLSALFKLKELPILLTLLFTLLGWTFMRLADKVTASPTIEYKYLSVNDTEFCYRLINLTNNKQFKNLNFRISTGQDEGIFTSGKLEEVAPAPKYNFAPEVESSLQSEITFMIKRFNPHTQYNLLVNFKGKIKYPILQLSYNNIQDQVITDPLVLKEASFFTFLIKNDTALYLILFIILLLFSILYLLNISKTIV